MHLVTKFLEGRGLAIIAMGTLAFLPVWLFLSSLPKTVPIPLSIDPVMVPTPPPPSHSNSRLLPFEYWNHRAVYPERYNQNSCMKLPSVSELNYAAYSWQLLPVENGSVYIYGAYYDARFKEQLVRILIYTDVTPVPKLLCQLWFLDDNEPQTELADSLYGWCPQWGGPTNGVNEPYLLTCRCRRHPPDSRVAPAAVAVVTAPCGVATNVLNVQGAPIYDELDLFEEYSGSQGTRVAVCLKWLHYRDDVSVQVIEWLQLVKHFGAEKVFIDIVRVHPNTRKVLQYYEDEDFVVVTELSHPPQVSGLRQSDGFRDFRDYRRELLPLNDCLYRSVIMGYNWITSLDMDEIIVPPPGSTWPELIENATATAAAEPGGTPVDTLVFPNYYVLDGAQKDLAAPAKTRILAHTWRSKTPNPPGNNVKSFFNVSSVTTMHNHMPLSCKGVPLSCNKRTLDNGPGRMLHFRQKCLDDREDCKELHDVVKEDILDGWRAPVLAEVREILEKLGLGGLE